MGGRDDENRAFPPSPGGGSAPRMMRGERVYRVLLCLLPRAFRERFGQDMTDLFRDRLRAARDEHRLGHHGATAALWVRALVDLVRQATAMRWDAARLRWSRQSPHGATLPSPVITARPAPDSPARLALTRARKDRLMSLSTVVQDLRYALASLRRERAFTLVAVLTLALGIGANTAIFSIINAVLLKPLDYPGAGRLVWLYETNPRGLELFVSLLNVRDWLERSRSLETGGVFVGQTMNLTGRERPDRVRGGFVSPGLVEMLNMKPFIGRSLVADDDRAGAPPVVVLEHDTWRRRFAGDRSIVGTALMLNNQPYTVVGVLEPGFAFVVDDDVEAWVPSHLRSADVLTNRETRAFFAFGRLRPGVSMAQARADLASVGEAMARLDPVVNGKNSVGCEPFPERLAQDARDLLVILGGAVACVLLIACVNLANLLLARGAARTRELALRAALGASRARLLRQLLTESFVLAALGGVAGLLIAHWGVRGLATMVPAPQMLVARATVDGSVMLFTLGLSVLTGLLFGLLPGLRLSRAEAQQALRTGGRGGTHDRSGHWIRGSLVIAEVALSLMLLVCAGLLVRSLVNLLDRSPGFNPDQVLSLEYRLPRNKYADEASQVRFHEQVVERVRQVPGVTDAALVQGLAFSGNGGFMTDFAIPRHAAARGGSSDGQEWQQSRFNAVTPDYFRTMQIPVRGGRTCEAGDRAEGPLVAIVNERLARLYWPESGGAGALGQALFLKDKRDRNPATIVGIVGDTKGRSLRERQESQIYLCYSQNAGTFATLVARTAIDPLSVAEAVKAAISSIDRDQPVWKVRTARWLVDRNVEGAHFTMRLMSGVAVLALLLAVIGIYGVMSYTVSQRTREIGVRMALGAERGDIARLVLGRGLLLTGAGVGLGWIGARWMTGLLDTMLVGVTTTDQATYASVALLLTLVALAACSLPAQRATRVDPVTSLRAD